MFCCFLLVFDFSSVLFILKNKKTLSRALIIWEHCMRSFSFPTKSQRLPLAEDFRKERLILFHEISCLYPPRPPQLLQVHVPWTKNTPVINVQSLCRLDGSPHSPLPYFLTNRKLEQCSRNSYGHRVDEAFPFSCVPVVHPKIRKREEIILSKMLSRHRACNSLCLVNYLKFVFIFYFTSKWKICLWI